MPAKFTDQPNGAQPTPGGESDFADTVRLLQTAYHHSPLSTIGYHPDGWLAFFNLAAEAFSGMPMAGMLGREGYNVRKDEQRVDMLPLFDQACAGKPAETAVYAYNSRDHEAGAGTRWVRTLLFPWVDPAGTVRLVLAQSLDMTAQKRAEAEREAMHDQVIAAQQAALRELSTPLMPLGDGVVVMPIIGSIDSTRAQQVMETLLEGVAAQNARIAILDITGVKVVDTQVAQALIRAAQAARLLGAEVVLSGISPEIAQTLVHIGADLSELITKSNLQHGIAYGLDKANKPHEHAAMRSLASLSLK